MASITLKDIPGDLHVRLKERARRNGRSMNSEAIACLEAAVMPEPVDPERLISRARELRSKVKVRVNDKLLRKSREERRR